MPRESQEKQLLNAGLEQSPVQRAAFLHGACHEKDDLHCRVEELLQAFDGPSKILADEPSRIHESSSLTKGPATIIAGCELLQTLGEADCGVVYMAEQEVPVSRCVALKIVKLVRSRDRESPKEQ